MKRIKQFYEDFLSLKPALWCLLILSLVIVIWVDLELPKIPELFSNGHKLQNLIYQLSLGYIVSLMFYYILVFPEEVKDRKATEFLLRKEISNHLAETAAYIHAMNANKNGHYTLLNLAYPSKEYFTELCKAWISTQDGYCLDPATISTITMWGRLRGISFAWDKMQDRIALRMKTADAEMRLKLIAIDHCQFLNLLRTFRGVADPGENFINACKKQFWEYLELNRQLANYCHRKYSTKLFDAYFLEAESAAR